MSLPSSSGQLIAITLLTQTDCVLCEHAKAVLDRVGNDYPLMVTEVDLSSQVGRDLATRHGVLFAPGVLIDGQSFSHGRLSEKKLRRHLAEGVDPWGGTP